MLRKIVIFLVAAVVQVTTNQSPVISYITKDQVVSVGDTVAFDCTVVDAENYTVSWSKKGNKNAADVVLSMHNFLSLNDPRYNITETKNETGITYTFRITNIEATDMGSYECQVIVSLADKVAQSVKLLVRHPPIISEEKPPKNVVVAEGASVEVTCSAKGYPEPNLSWKREDNSIMPAGGHLHRGATLNIRETHRLDRGGYYCIADNGEGVPDERIVRIEVEFRPQITVLRPKVAQMLSHSADLKCSVQAYPSPAVYWYKDGNQLQSGKDYLIETIGSAQETTNSILRIYSIGEHDYGDYFCNATNKLGYADAKLNLFQSVIPVPTD